MKEGRKEIGMVGENERGKEVEKHPIWMFQLPSSAVSHVRCSVPGGTR